MNEDLVRRINLLDHLEQEHPDVPPPPEDAADSWTEAQIRAHYQKRAAQPASLNGVGNHAHVAHDPAANQRPDAAAADVHPDASTGARLGMPEGDNADPDQPGGGRIQPDQPELDPANAPPSLRQHQLTATVAGYRAAAIAHGIPFRQVVLQDSALMYDGYAGLLPAGDVPQVLSIAQCNVDAKADVAEWHPVPTAQPAAGEGRLQLLVWMSTVHVVLVRHRRHGLFPPHDPLLAELAARHGSHAFEKHMAGAASSYQPLPTGGWTTGDAACRAGFDLRMFYQVRWQIYVRCPSTLAICTATL